MGVITFCFLLRVLGNPCQGYVLEFLTQSLSYAPVVYLMLRSVVFANTWNRGIEKPRIYFLVQCGVCIGYACRATLAFRTQSTWMEGFFIVDFE